MIVCKPGKLQSYKIEDRVFDVEQYINVHLQYFIDLVKQSLDVARILENLKCSWLHSIYFGVV
jgi:hypothetical protein